MTKNFCPLTKTRSLFQNAIYLLLTGAFLFLAAGIQAQSKKIKTIIIDPGHGGSDTGTKGDYEGGLESKEKDVTLAISMKLVDLLRKRIPDVTTIPTRTTDTFMSVKEKANFANEHHGDLFVCIHADAVLLKTGSRIIGYKNETYTTTKHVGKGKKRRRIVTKHTRRVPIREYYKIPTSRKGTSTLILVARQSSDKVKAMENSNMDFITDDGDSTANVNYDSPEWKASAILYSQKYFRRSYQLANLVQDEVSTITGRPNLGVWQREKGLWVLHATQMPAVLIETGFLVNYDDERYLNSEKGQQEIAEGICDAIIKYRDQVDGISKTTAQSVNN